MSNICKILNKKYTAIRRRRTLNPNRFRGYNVGIHDIISCLIDDFWLNIKFQSHIYNNSPVMSILSQLDHVIFQQLDRIYPIIIVVELFNGIYSVASFHALSLSNAIYFFNMQRLVIHRNRKKWLNNNSENIPNKPNIWNSDSRKVNKHHFLTNTFSTF